MAAVWVGRHKGGEQGEVVIYNYYVPFIDAVSLRCPRWTVSSWPAGQLTRYNAATL